MRPIDADKFKEHVQQQITQYFTSGTGGYMLAEDVIEDIDSFPTANVDDTIKQLTVERDAFREYAYTMRALIENIKQKENEGYQPSAARYAAEMDTWRVVAAEKRALQEENERLRLAFIAECDLSRCTREKEIRASVVKELREKLMKYTESTSECTIDNPLAETYSVVREEYIDQVINEVLEDGYAKDT